MYNKIHCTCCKEFFKVSLFVGLIKEIFIFKSALMMHVKKYLRGSITELTQLTQVCHRLSKPFTFMYFLKIEIFL